MNKIKEALAAIAAALKITEGKLAHARARVRFNAKRAQKKHAKALRAEVAADRARANAARTPAKARGYTRHARRKDKQASRCHAAAHTYQDRAQWWTGRVKELVREVEGLQRSYAEKLEDLAEWKKKHGVSVNGNKVTGGTPRQRLVAFDLAAIAGCSSGRRPNYYSQPGQFQVELGITGERLGIDRSDCSSYVTSGHWSCGLPDPNGTNWTWGFTGTIRQTLEQIPLALAQNGDLVVYGSGSGHHVERILDIKNRVTAGHGSAPVDRGTIDLFGDGEYTIHRAVAA